MATSLETRIPMLDHRVAKLAWSLPANMKFVMAKVNGFSVKLNRHVPNNLIERPKRDFPIPLGDWLRGPLQGWTEDLLDAHTLTQQGLLTQKLFSTDGKNIYQVNEIGKTGYGLY